MMVPPQAGQPKKKQGIADVLLQRAVPGMVSSHGPGSGAPPTAGRGITPPGRPNLPPPVMRPMPGKPGMVSSHGPGSGAPPTGRVMPKGITPPGRPNLPPGRGPVKPPVKPPMKPPIARPVPPKSWDPNGPGRRPPTPTQLPGPTNLPPGGGMTTISDPPMMPPQQIDPVTGAASHGPGSGAPPTATDANGNPVAGMADSGGYMAQLPQMQQDGGMQASDQLRQAQANPGSQYGPQTGWTGGSDWNWNQGAGGGLQGEMMRRFQMQQQGQDYGY